jgi:hypothetical protein
MRPRPTGGFGLATEASEIVSAYVSALGGRLPGGRRARSLVLAEIVDGLACAIEARVQGGQSPAEAAHAAVDEFGEPNEVAAAFARQMLTTTAHRTGVSLVMSGPIVGLVWASAWGAHTTSWSGKIDAVLSGVRGLPLLLLLIVPCAVAAASASGRFGRWLNLPMKWMYPAALAATGGCMALDATMVGVVLIGARAPTDICDAAGRRGRCQCAAGQCRQRGYEPASACACGFELTPAW